MDDDIKSQFETEYCGGNGGGYGGGNGSYGDDDDDDDSNGNDNMGIALSYGAISIIMKKIKKW